MSYSTPAKVRRSGSRQIASTPPSSAGVATDAAQTPISVSGGERKPRAEKVFTEEDEIQLLNSVLKIARSSSAPVVKLDSTIFIQMRKSLRPKVFTRKQLDDKFRRLRIKYQKLARSRSSIKTPHDRQIYEIGRLLWIKNSSRDDQNGGAEKKEKEEKSSAGFDIRKYPVLMEECEKNLEATGSRVWSRIIEGSLEESKVREINDKLVMVRYEEATVMAKKAKLLQELTQLILGSVTSSSSSRKV